MHRGLTLIAFLSVACASADHRPVSPIADAAAHTAARAPRSGALFVVDFEALLPVGCYDAHRRAWLSGADCLALVPDDATLLLEGGRVAKAFGRRNPTPTQCTLATPLVNVDGAMAERPGAFALWPATANGRIRRFEWTATKGGAKELPEKDRGRVVAAMTKLGAPSGVRLVQSAAADLDDDGTSEVVYSVTSDGFEPATRKGLSALLVSDHRAGELLVVRSSDHAVFRVEGVVDLDDDGRKELWLSERTYHPNGTRSDSMTLAWPATGGLTPLTPVESCWPPGKG